MSLHFKLIKDCNPNIESQTGLGWKKPYRSPHSSSPATGRDPVHQPRLLKIASSLALSTAREGAATVSLGSLGQGLTTLRVKNFFLISDLNLPSFSLKPSPLVLSLQAIQDYVSHDLKYFFDTNTYVLCLEASNKHFSLLYWKDAKWRTRSRCWAFRRLKSQYQVHPDPSNTSLL